MVRRDELEANSKKQGKSRGSSPLGDRYLIEAEKVLSRASLSGAAGGDGSGKNDKSLKQSEARRRGADLLQKAAIEYCAANLLGNAAKCYDRAVEILNFERIGYNSFTILSNALKFYRLNVQYDKAEQVTLKLIDLATEKNDISSIAHFNCKLANIFVLKRSYGKASKHYVRAYNLYRVDGYHFYRCIDLLEKFADLSILRNDFEAAAKYFLMLVEACHKYKSGRLNDGEYIVKACLSFLVDNPNKSTDYFIANRQNANFLQSNIDMVKGIINAVQKKKYDSFKSLIGVKYSSKLDTDHTLKDIIFAIEKKYFLVENGSEKKYGKVPAAADDDINLKNQLEDEKIDTAHHNKSKVISKDNSPTAQSIAKSSANAQGKE
ncbi:MAG: hypothetical protein MHMPM18_001140 [Marteilia pararefringens]